VLEVVLLQVLRQRSLFDLVRHRATVIEGTERFNHCGTAANGASHEEADLSRDGHAEATSHTGRALKLRGGGLSRGSRALEPSGERFGELGHFVVAVLGEHAYL
jgi:hypothetical protein